MTDGETYKRARTGLGLSRADVSAMAKRAGHKVSPTSVERLEKKGTEAAGGRGLSFGALGWIEYIYGMSDPAGVVKWPTVERGAPVIVHGEKGTWQLHATDGTDITVFGGRHNEERFRTFPADRVRLVALTALPPPETARVFESRYKGSDSVYAAKIMGHIRATPGAHSVGAIAYMLGMNNAIVSRVAADLAKKGDLVKVSRGVFIIPLAEDLAPCGHRDDDPQDAAESPGELSLPDAERLEDGAGPATFNEERQPEATSVKSALAERIMAPGRPRP